MRANLYSFSHRCHLFKVAFVCELTIESIHLPLDCLQTDLSLSLSLSGMPRAPSAAPAVTPELRKLTNLYRETSMST